MEPKRHRVVIVGGGVVGLGAAIRLLKEGIGDFVILEKGARLGGTWRDNTYPGCACDVPSQLYSFSFALNAEWGRVFAEHAEIQSYLEATAEGFKVTPHVIVCHFGCRCRSSSSIRTTPGVSVSARSPR